MVKKIGVVFGIFLAGLWVLSGCSKFSNPVTPRVSGGTVNMMLPVAAIKARVKAQNIVSLNTTLIHIKYHITPQ